MTSARRDLSIADLREGMEVDEATYKQLALEDRHGHWELHDGRLVQKPGKTVWRRQPDGTYRESVVHGGVVELAALPGVRITIDELFEY